MADTDTPLLTPIFTTNLAHPGERKWSIQLLWFEVRKMLIAVKKIRFILLFLKIIFGTLSFPVS